MELDPQSKQTGGSNDADYQWNGGYVPGIVELNLAKGLIERGFKVLPGDQFVCEEKLQAIFQLRVSGGDVYRMLTSSLLAMPDFRSGVQFRGYFVDEWIAGSVEISRGDAKDFVAFIRSRQFLDAMTLWEFIVMAPLEVPFTKPCFSTAKLVDVLSPAESVVVFQQTIGTYPGDWWEGVYVMQRSASDGY